MKITLPEGFQMPASAKPGQPFEVVATLMMDDEGVSLKALDGVEIPEMEEMEEVEMEEVADPKITLPFGES
jgi:hypothetical protein